MRTSVASSSPGQSDQRARLGPALGESVDSWNLSVIGRAQERAPGPGPFCPSVPHLATDQRGGTFARVSGAAADIGAFEVQQVDVIFRNGFDGPL